MVDICTVKKMAFLHEPGQKSKGVKLKILGGRCQKNLSSDLWEFREVPKFSSKMSFLGQKIKKIGGGDTLSPLSPKLMYAIVTF
jgi:hypothetical protein